jgi:hypothetical protein
MIIATNKLAAGMELAADVMNVNGMMLLGRGTILTERHLHVLKTWGIDSVHVTGGDDGKEEPSEESEIPPVVLSQAQIRVNLRFRHVKGDSNRINTIKKLAVRRAARTISTTQRPPNAP